MDRQSLDPPGGLIHGLAVVFGGRYRAAGCHLSGTDKGGKQLIDKLPREVEPEPDVPPGDPCWSGMGDQQGNPMNF